MKLNKVLAMLFMSLSIFPALSFADNPQTVDAINNNTDTAVQAVADVAVTEVEAVVDPIDLPSSHADTNTRFSLGNDEIARELTLNQEGLADSKKKISLARLVIDSSANVINLAGIKQANEMIKTQNGGIVLQ